MYISEATMQSIANLPQVKQIGFYECNVNSNHFQLLANFKTLNKIYLICTRINNEQVKSIRSNGIDINVDPENIEFSPIDHATEKNKNSTYHCALQ